MPGDRCKKKDKPTFKPKNTQLPFFTYGVFRPGEIPFLGIRDFVNTSKICKIKGCVRIRDGVFIYSDGDQDVMGFLLDFKDDCQEKAYDYISSLEPDLIFRWEEQMVGDIKANMLFGKKPDNGSEDLEEIEREYSTLQDPYITEALEMLLDESKSNYLHKFHLQMRYLFLWTIIERFNFLRYSFGGGPMNGIARLASNEYIKVAIGKVQANGEVVYRTDTLKKVKLDPTNPKKSLSYYYTIRSNLTHRGKGRIKDEILLEKAYLQLLEISSYVISETLKECQSIKELNND